MVPGHDLVKRRYHDQYWGGALRGLVMCESEAASAADLAGLEFPPYAAREVTRAPFFTGGNLCKATTGDVRAALAAVATPAG